ncbi:MAG: T9SS type A sorting domain-containing protein, partial [Saprospiraceae bacterium]
LPQTEYFRMWIDLNRDADFDDEGELLFEAADNQTISGSITISESAANGATLLRIAMDREHFPMSCEPFTYGEVEDYSVVITDDIQPLSIRPPAELLTLEAKVASEVVELSWLNNTGPVNESYIIERSTNGLDYTAVMELNAYEATGQPQFVQWTDDTPQEGSNFYRIKLIFEDSTTRYSDYRQVRIFHTAPFTIYPNPAQRQTTIDLSNQQGKTVEIQIYNQFGKLSYQSQTTDYQKTISLENLQNGVYFVYIVTNGRKSKGQKMVVMNMY